MLTLSRGCVSVQLGENAMEVLAAIIIIIVPQLPPWAPFLGDRGWKEDRTSRDTIKILHTAKATEQYWYEFVRVY